MPTKYKKKNSGQADGKPDSLSDQLKNNRETDNASGTIEAGQNVANSVNGEGMPDLTPEEMRARLLGSNRAHVEALGDAWGGLTGMDPSAVVPQIVGTVLHEGGTRPAWQWKHKGREHVLMAWPQDQPLRASVLVAGPEDGKLSPITVVPLLEGIPNDLTVEEVHPWESGLGANVAVNMIEGKNPMWFFDPLYGRDQSDLTPGVTHSFLLAGLAYGFQKAILDDMTITSGPFFEEHASAWLAENPDKDRIDVPPLKVSMDGKRLIMPGRNFCEYQLRATVEQIEECQLEKMPILIAHVSFPFESRPPMRLPIYVSKVVLGDFKPEVGQEIDAYIWMQGRIIDFGE